MTSGQNALSALAARLVVVRQSGRCHPGYRCSIKVVGTDHFTEPDGRPGATTVGYSERKTPVGPGGGSPEIGPDKLTAATKLIRRRIVRFEHAVDLVAAPPLNPLG